MQQGVAAFRQFPVNVFAGGDAQLPFENRIDSLRGQAETPREIAAGRVPQKVLVKISEHGRKPFALLPAPRLLQQIEPDQLSDAGELLLRKPAGAMKQLIGATEQLMHGITVLPHGKRRAPGRRLRHPGRAFEIEMNAAEKRPFGVPEQPVGVQLAGPDGQHLARMLDHPFPGVVHQILELSPQRKDQLVVDQPPPSPDRQLHTGQPPVIHEPDSRRKGGDAGSLRITIVQVKAIIIHSKLPVPGV